MTEIQTFTNAAFGKVRILYEDGKPLFCGTDVCKALGYSNQRKALLDHCLCVTKRDVPHPQSAAKHISMNFLTEGDLYRLICHSKLPSAEKFEHWVFDEVLPTLRQTGQYGADPAELERLRRSNATLQSWLGLLADRKRDLVDIQSTLADVRKERDEAKSRYMTVKANYSKWCDLVRTFENLTRQAQADINSYIDQIQIVAATAPELDADVNAMLDSMACELLCVSQKHSTV